MQLKFYYRYPNKSISPECDYTKNMLHDAFTYIEKRIYSLKLPFEECEKILYVGSKYNARNVLLKFQNFMTQFGWCDASFELFLGVLKNGLLSNNTIDI